MSIDEIFTLALWMAALSIAALVLVGRRKPARATRRLPRGAAPSTTSPRLVELDTVLEPHTPLVRRIAAALGLSVTAAVVGALIAIVVSVTVAITVVTITGLLG